MSKIKRKATIEWLLALILIFLVIKDSIIINYHHLSPVAAHEQSERTYYYGPSEIAEEFDLGDVRLYLGKYKDWFSANTVQKTAAFFWVPGSHVSGTEIKPNQALTYSWSGSSINEELMLMMFYGIVTNPEITTVELVVNKGLEDQKVLTYNLKDHRMFLFHWNELKTNYRWESIRGLGENGEIIYEEKLN